MSIVDKIKNTVGQRLQRIRKQPRSEEEEIAAALQSEIAALPEAASGKPAAGDKEPVIEQFFTKMQGADTQVDIDLKAVLAPENQPETTPADGAQKAPAAAPASAPAPEAEPAGDGGLISSLFEQEEVEENSVTAKLIQSLPEVTVEEILNDLNDLRSTMAEMRLTAAGGPVAGEAGRTAAGPGRLPANGK